MASKQTTIVVTHRTEALQTIKDKLQKSGTKARTECVALSNFFNACALGNRDASFTVKCDTGDAAAATGTITFSSIVNDDTFTIGTQTFTAKASPSGANEFSSATSDTARAAAAVLKINAHASLAGVVTATSSLGVITVTCAQAGLIGNQIGLAISAHGSVSASKMASGANAGTTSGPNTYHAGA